MRERDVQNKITGFMSHGEGRSAMKLIHRGFAKQG